MTTQPELPETVGPLAPVVRLVADNEQPRYDVDFEGFVRRYESRLRRLVLRRLGDPSEAEEITQETMLRAYQHRASFATEDELMAWSTVVAQRLVIDRVRVRGRSVAVAEVPESARLGRDTADIVVARHEARAALEALEAIPTRQAAILWAREVEGLHYEDIAQRFDITEPAVRSLLHRGRKALRKEFKDRTGTLPLNGLVPFAPWLLALRAAGHLRKAAKSTATNPATTTVALALIGVTALSIGPWLRDPVRTPNFQRPGATSSRPADAGTAERTAALADRSGVTKATSRPGGTVVISTEHSGVNNYIPDVDICSTGSDGSTPRGTSTVMDRCTVVSSPKQDSVMVWVGPPLPENPTGMRRAGVGTSGFFDDCSDVPDVPGTDCTMYNKDEGNPPPPGDAPSQPTPPSASLPASGAQR